MKTGHLFAELLPISKKQGSTVIAHVYLDLLPLFHFQYHLAKSMAGDEQVEAVARIHPVTNRKAVEIFFKKDCNV